MNRRQFASLSVCTAGAALTPGLWAARSNVDATAMRFYIAIIADTHVIDPMYHGHEETVEDTESLYQATDRFRAARDFINLLDPRIEQVVHLGDLFHDYPSNDYNFYFKHCTRIDIFKSIMDGFHAPVHMLPGNHDYGLPGISRTFTHRLLAEKLGILPYSFFDYKGWKFLHLNCFLGDTWDRKSARYDRGTGSLGQEQLQWADAQLSEGRRTLVFIHYPLWIIKPTEFADVGLHTLVRKHQDTIKLVVSGHWHKWIDFAHTFGPQHYVMAATRYDENAYMLLELDSDTSTCRFVNADLVGWSTHFSKPYVE